MLELCNWRAKEMTRKYKDRYLKSVAFERADYEKLRTLLPKGESISSEIKRLVKQRIEDTTTEQKGKS